MEKEVLIINLQAVVICLIYIERLIIKEEYQVTSSSWRVLVFIALVLANKIWDDESFENENFSKAFPQYSTSDINQLESVFLKVIEYELYIKSSDYAKYYYILRVIFCYLQSFNCFKFIIFYKYLLLITKFEMNLKFYLKIRNIIIYITIVIC